MQPAQKKIWFFIGRNILFYLLLISITYVSVSAEVESRARLYAVYWVILVFYVWAVIHNTVLFERFFLRRNYLAYFILLAAGLLLTSLGERAIQESAGAHLRNLKSIVIANFLYTIGGLACYLAYKYMMERHTFYQTKVMQRDIELQQLKAQLNPHFLFNALNNIYSYTLQHNRFGDELILKLSELMRFILDCADKTHIRIIEELAFIRNYIVFERERLGERCEINFYMKEGDPERPIAPLILFPFIENACKYGANTIQRTSIDIRIENEEAYMKMSVTNSIVNKHLPSTRTGLHNAVRRLELLYPAKHEIFISSNDDLFSVELIIRYED